MIVFDHGPARDQLEQACGYVVNPRVDHWVTRHRLTHEGNTALMGGIIFAEYTGNSTKMHVAGFEPRWLNKELLWIAFDYPFNILKCQKVFATMPSDNLKSKNFALKLGFKHENTIPQVFRSADLLILSMHRGECRWLDIDIPLPQDNDG
jgi:RimJ/RimL family protein N-acetyltransferase